MSEVMPRIKEIIAILLGALILLLLFYFFNTYLFPIDPAISADAIRNCGENCTLI